MPYFPGIGTQGTGEHYYRLVATHGGGQVDDSTRSIEAILASKRTQAWANNCGEAYFAAQRAGAAESLAGAIVFGYSMIPGAAGLLHAADGEWREAAISWSGDAAMVFAGPMAGAVKSARVAKAFRYTGAAIQGGIGATRTYDALQAWQQGDNIQAAGYLGEAVLRMLGMRKDAIAALKTKVPNAASAGRPLSSFADEAAQIQANAAASRGLTPNATNAAMRKVEVDLSRLSPPSSRPFADPVKLERMGPFDWSKYEPIWVQEEGGRLTIMNGMTRVEAAQRAGITKLPAYIFKE